MSRRGPRRFGRYELLTELARGGMAVLHLARLHGAGGFEKIVTIKVILPHLTDDQQFRELFLNEGNIAARLMHQNVCNVFELGEVDGQLFLAMEYLSGVSWEELCLQLPDEPHTILRTVAGVLGQACDGLHYAHELHDLTGEPTPVVHRDVSPQNLFVTVDGLCKVLDFGVSKLLSDGKHTRTGVIKGKLPYMPPEQIRGENIDRRADVFAAGVVAWEALANERLFLRDSDFLIWKALTEEPIPTVSSRQPAFGADVDAVITRALARDRDQRYPTIAAFAADLRKLAEAYGGEASAREIGDLVRVQCDEQLAARSRQVVAAIAASREPATAPSDEPDASATASMAMRRSSVVLGADRARRWPLVLLGLAATATIAGVFAVRRGGDGRPVVAAAPIAIDAGVVVPVDAPPPDAPAVIAIDAGAPPRTRTRTTTKPPPPPATAAQPGQLSVSSDPYAVIYIDGIRVGDTTPIYKARISAGKHELRAVRSDGKEQRRTIHVEPAKHVNLGTLAW